MGVYLTDIFCFIFIIRVVFNVGSVLLRTLGFKVTAKPTLSKEKTFCSVEGKDIGRNNGVHWTCYYMKKIKAL